MSQDAAKSTEELPQWVPFLRDAFTVIPGEEEYFWRGKRRLFADMAGKWSLVVGCAEAPFDPNRPLPRADMRVRHIWRIGRGIDSLAQYLSQYGGTNVELLRSLGSEQQDILIGTPTIYSINPAPRYPWDEEKHYRYLYEEIVLLAQPLDPLTNSNSFSYFKEIGRMRLEATDKRLTLLFSGVQLTGRPAVLCNVWRVPPECQSVQDALRVLRERLTEAAVSHLNRAVATIDRKLLFPCFTERLADEALANTPTLEETHGR